MGSLGIAFNLSPFCVVSEAPRLAAELHDLRPLQAPWVLRAFRVLGVSGFLGFRVLKEFRAFRALWVLGFRAFRV